MNVKVIGEHKRYETCRFCESKNIETIIDFGNVALAGGFIKSRETPEKFYPLSLYFCKDCTIVSVRDIVSAEVLFKDYYYSSSASATLREHFREYAERLVGEVSEASKIDPTILEIGCNDGVLLSQFPSGVKTIGVDPSSVTKKYRGTSNTLIFNECFSDKLDILEGSVDLITSSNCMAHIEDMDSIMKGISKYLKINGILVIEVHYLETLIMEMNWDMIYSEHMTYYSVTAMANFLKKYGFNIYNVEKIQIHGGSIRVYSSRGEQKRSLELEEILRNEKKTVCSIDYYKDFYKKIKDNNEKLRKLLFKLLEEKRRIISYGASGRANTVMAMYNLTRNELGDIIIDDSPLKWGMYTPFNHLEIVGSEILATQRGGKFDYILLFAWTYKTEILKKYPQYTGKIINPIACEIC